MADLNDVMNEEEIVSRHRKERKELQSKIQALKRSATKGDKKKKKEVTEEIALLEHELDERHTSEIAQFKQLQHQVNKITASLQTLPAQNLNDDRVAPQVTQRISKAQKRRDKKAVKEREREILIKAQEKENIHGARNVETQKIKSILKEKNLMIQDIPSDGNCLYSAVNDQLKYIGREEVGFQRLRHMTSQYMLEHITDYLPFISLPDSGDLLTEDQYHDYCDKVANTTAWGGEIELRALSHALKCSIEVIQAVGPAIVVGEEYSGKQITLTYHRHMFGLGEHYNSVKPYEEPSEEEALQNMY